MADGFTLTLDEDLAALLHRRAQEIGASPELVARMTLQQGLFRYDDYEWINGDPRTAVDDADDDAVATIPLEDVALRMRSKLDALLAAKK